MAKGETTVGGQVCSECAIHQRREIKAVLSITAGGEGEVRTLVRHGVRLPVFKTGLLRPLEYFSVCNAESAFRAPARASLSDSAEAYQEGQYGIPR